MKIDICPWKFSKNSTRETEVDAREKNPSFSPWNWKQKLFFFRILPVKTIFATREKKPKNVPVKKKVAVKKLRIW